MGINARLRYAISWLIIKVIVKVVTWMTTAVTMLMLAVTMAALWFSPELQRHETIRILSQMNEKPSEDD